MKFFEFMFSSFPIWLGMMLLIWIPIKVIAQIISRLIRRSMVIKHGWPPSHLDADGDPIPNETKKAE